MKEVYKNAYGQTAIICDDFANRQLTAEEMFKANLILVVSLSGIAHSRKYKYGPNFVGVTAAAQQDYERLQAENKQLKHTNTCLQEMFASSFEGEGIMTQAANKFEDKNLQLQQQLDRAQELLQEIYNWTKFKQTAWARKTAVLLEELDTHDCDEDCPFCAMEDESNG